MAYLKYSLVAVAIIFLGGKTFAQSQIQIGKAVFYADKFEGHVTASGEIFQQDKLTAAHATLPLNTLVEVTHLQSGKKITVKINDRMSYRPERIIQLSGKVREKLQMADTGVVYIKIRTLDDSKIPRYKPDTTDLSPKTPNSGLFSVDIAPVYRSGYGVQVGLYKNIDNLGKRLKALRFGWGDNVLLYISKKQETTFKVILGPFETRYKAEAFKSNLPVLLGNKEANGFIVALDEL